jgi:hypothetical protein
MIVGVFRGSGGMEYDLTLTQISTCLVEVTYANGWATHQNSHAPTCAAWNLACDAWHLLLTRVRFGDLLSHPMDAEKRWPIAGDRRAWLPR